MRRYSGFHHNSFISISVFSIGNHANTLANSKTPPLLCLKFLQSQHKTFQIKGYVPKHKGTGVGKALKGALSIQSLGLSNLIGNSISSSGNKNWYSFDDLVSYELLADDSVVVSGGEGQALIGGLAFGAAGAVAGGITGKRKQKKKIGSINKKILAF